MEEGGLPPLNAADRASYDRTCLIPLTSRVVEGLLKVRGDAVELDRDKAKDAAELVQHFDDRIEKHADVAGLLIDFDVYRPLRRLFHLVYKIIDLGDDQYVPVQHLLNRQVELLDIVRVRMEELIDIIDISWEPT